MAILAAAGALIGGAVAWAYGKGSWPLWLALPATAAIMGVLAYAIERLVLRHLVNQEGIILFMATLGIAYFLDGFGQTLWGSDIYKINLGLPKDPIFLFEDVFPGGLLVEPGDLVAALHRRACWSRCWRSSSRRRASAARCAPSPTTMPRPSRSASRSTPSG